MKQDTTATFLLAGELEGALNLALAPFEAALAVSSDALAHYAECELAMVPVRHETLQFLATLGTTYRETMMAAVNAVYARLGELEGERWTPVEVLEQAA